MLISAKRRQSNGVGRGQVAAVLLDARNACNGRFFGVIVPPASKFGDGGLIQRLPSQAK